MGAWSIGAEYLKCDPDLAVHLRLSYPAITGGHHLNKRHWNTVVLDGSVPDGLLRGRGPQPCRSVSTIRAARTSGSPSA